MLKPLSKIYGAAADLRNALYDRGVLRSHALGAKTVSIGNLSFGGTGKTPLVARVAGILADAGEKVCILTRGYGRKQPRDRVLVSDWNQLKTTASIAGDEPVELAKKLLGKAIVVSDADRISAARWASDTQGVTAFVLDDAFQHRKARRDIDIVCVDATNPFSMLREPFANISRADAVVITRSDIAADLEQLAYDIRLYNGRAHMFRAGTRIVRSRRLDDFLSSEGRSEVSNFNRDLPVFAFCGIANPQVFFRSLEVEGFSVVGKRAFRDHHTYTAKDIDELQKAFASSGANALVTTAKDAVKLGESGISVPCFVIEIEMSLDDEAAFSQMITS